MHPDLPQQVKLHLAQPEMRWRHRYWHMVKNRSFWDSDSPLRAPLDQIGWRPPRLTGEDGAGIDFLDMHRKMIEMVNMMLGPLADPSWPKVEAWQAIPVDGTDPDWPIPVIPGLDNTPWTAGQMQNVGNIGGARNSERVSEMMNIATNLRNPAVLTNPGLSIDQLGIIVEGTVHNWMHMFFSDVAPISSEDVGIENDWLGTPFSSHVNPYFWKLHGWVDDCITSWEQARGETADFTTAWIVPSEAPPPDVLLPGFAAGLVQLDLEFQTFKIFEESVSLAKEKLQ